MDGKILEKIKQYTDEKKYTTDEVGMSDSQVLLFDDMVLKIQPHSEEADNEATVCGWLAQRIPTPKILAYEVSDGKSYCLMSKVPGKMICDDAYMTNPEKLLDLVCSAMKLLWSVNIKDCPCDSSLSVKLKRARYRVEHGLVDMDNVEPETFGENGFRNPEELLCWLEENRPPEDLVFSHGDFSLPNIFAHENQISGFIDLGKAGIADRWQDLAICYRSLKHNFEGKYNGGHPYKGYSPEQFFERMGIRENPEKLKYYILLDELF